MTDDEKKLLQAKHRMEEAEARDHVKERKARTRRLIQEGAILEKVFPAATGMELEALLQYHLLHGRAKIKGVSGSIDWNQPLVDECRSVKKEIREKQAQKKELLTQKRNTSIFSPIRLVQLNQQITTLTEEIEELKTRRSQLMHKVGCQNETEMKEAEGTLSQMSAYVKKLTAQQETLTSQLQQMRRSTGRLKQRSYRNRWRSAGRPCFSPRQLP